MFSQEEPRNCGAWSFVRPRLDYALGARTAYAGRPEMPTRNCTIEFLVVSSEKISVTHKSATGNGVQHKQQIVDMLNSAFE